MLVVPQPRASGRHVAHALLRAASILVSGLGIVEKTLEEAECPRHAFDVVHGKVIVMGDRSVPTALDGLLEPLSRCLDAESAQRIAEFRVDPAVQARIGVLAERANDGVLSDDEQGEYEALISAADFISILKLKAQRQLKSNGS